MILNSRLAIGGHCSGYAPICCSVEPACLAGARRRRVARTNRRTAPTLQPKSGRHRCSGELDRKTGQSKRCWMGRRQLGSAVEQRFCKPWVIGSILTAGSTSKLRAQQWTLRGNKCNWRSKLPNRRAELRNATESGDSQSSPLRKFDDATNDTVRIEGTNFAAAFSRSAGTLTSLVYDGREMLASDKKVAQASCPPNASGQAANSIIQRQAGRRRYFRAGGVGTLRGFTGTNASFLLFRPYPAPGASDR